MSIPSRRDLTTLHSLSNGWTVVDEYVEPGASATDDRRPVFQAMLERACDADHPYDVIVVHSFSRFFRDGATMELTIRKLRRHGVEVDVLPAYLTRPGAALTSVHSPRGARKGLDPGRERCA